MENELSILENASMMVDMCRHEYERLGFSDAALLRGMEITDAASADLAIMLIESLPNLSCTKSVRDCTIETLTAVTGKAGLRAAS